MFERIKFRNVFQKKIPKFKKNILKIETQNRFQKRVFEVFCIVHSLLFKCIFVISHKMGVRRHKYPIKIRSTHVKIS